MKHESSVIHLQVRNLEKLW